MKPKQMQLPKDYLSQSSGIMVEYIKSRDVLNIWGWYDHFVGIESTEIPFKDFCEQLGIDPLKKR